MITAQLSRDPAGKVSNSHLSMLMEALPQHLYQALKSRLPHNVFMQQMIETSYQAKAPRDTHPEDLIIEVASTVPEILQSLKNAHKEIDDSLSARFDHHYGLLWPFTWKLIIKD